MIRQNSESKIRHIGHQICSKSIGKQKNWSVSRLNYTAKVSVGNTWIINSRLSDIATILSYYPRRFIGGPQGLKRSVFLRPFAFYQEIKCVQQSILMVLICTTELSEIHASSG